MAKPASPAKRAHTKRRGSANPTSRLMLGILFGIILSFTGILAYLRLGNPPVAVTDRSALWERPLRSIPMHARIAAEIKGAPFPAGEDAFEAGARTYRTQCASCHGTPGRESALGKAMAPHAQQFFSVRDRRATADKSPGELYWKTTFGLRRSGMPAYRGILSDTQLWQTSLLLHSAGDDLPEPVRAILTQPDTH